MYPPPPDVLGLSFLLTAPKFRLVVFDRRLPALVALHRMASHVSLEPRRLPPGCFPPLRSPPLWQGHLATLALTDVFRFMALRHDPGLGGSLPMQVSIKNVGLGFSGRFM